MLSFLQSKTTKTKNKYIFNKRSRRKNKILFSEKQTNLKNTVCKVVLLK